MHVVTYKDEREYRFSFVTLRATIDFIMKLREKNIPFTHIFEE